MAALRRIGLGGTELARATSGTIRLKLLKTGALITTSVPQKQGTAPDLTQAASSGDAALRASKRQPRLIGSSPNRYPG